MCRIAALVVVLLLSACGGGGEQAATEQASEGLDVITGSVTVGIEADQAVMKTWAEGVATCTGADVASGFADVGPAAGVTVRDESGDIIATGTVAEGERTIQGCVLPLRVDDVPEAKFYEVEVGRRGGVRSSRADLEADGFEVHLTIGT